MLEKLTSSDFAPLLNQNFQISAEGMETVTAVLIDLTELGSEPGEDDIANRRAFSLVFRIPGDTDTFLPQQIYQVSHDNLGSLDIFLVPLGPDKVGMKYEAMFT